MGAEATTGGEPALLPLPRSVEWRPGRLDTSGVADPHTALDQTLPPDAYRLEVTSREATLVAGSAEGLRYGRTVLRQLAGADGTAPAVVIADQPRLRWRGLMLDVARTFLPLDFLYRVVDAMSDLRLNVLHLHLTDDQGWRFEVLRHPRLTAVGGWRSRTRAGHALEEREPEARYTEARHGGFYRQDELRTLVAYAGERGITVVPEIDLPGHVQAALAAYPELGNTDVREPPTEPWPDWGVNERVLNVEDKTVAFFRDVLTELVAVFPSPYIHLGGDECPTVEWAASPRARARMADLGIAEVRGLQGWFLREVAEPVRAAGRRLVGWDELLEVDPPPDAVIVAWRSAEQGAEAARAGHEVVMAPQQVLYFDHYQADPAREPLAIGGLSTVAAVYRHRLVPPGLSPAEVERVIGAQAQLWTEYVPTPEHAAYMLFPRLAAFAERVWRGDDADDDLDDFRRRLPGHLARLEALGLAHRPASRRTRRAAPGPADEHGPPC